MDQVRRLQKEPPSQQGSPTPPQLHHDLPVAEKFGQGGSAPDEFRFDAAWLRTSRDPRRAPATVLRSFAIRIVPGLGRPHRRVAQQRHRVLPKICVRILFGSGDTEPVIPLTE